MKSRLSILNIVYDVPYICIGLPIRLFMPKSSPVAGKVCFPAAQLSKNAEIQGLAIFPKQINE